MATSLALQNIEKSFGDVKVIHGVNLEVEQGEFVVFVGPSGCGKSTLLRIIAGLANPTSGEVILEGREVNQVPASERDLSMVFQSYALYPHMSVRENLSFGLENLRFDKEEIERRIEEAATILQMDHLMDRRPGQLSGGQRQRVAIGRSIVREPIIFLFDEPLSNLDAELRLQMRVEISNLHAQLKNTMIYVTHDQVEAMTMADRIVVLRGGRVEQIGEPLDVYNHPENKFVAGFIGAPQMNFLRSTVVSGGVDIEAGMTKEVRLEGVSLGDEVVVGIRPETFAVSLEPKGSVMEATIENFEQLGAVTNIYAVLPTGEKITAQMNSQPSLKRGQDIGLDMTVEKMHVFASDEQGRSLLAK